jgi:hypothetical protein
MNLPRIAPKFLVVWLALCVLGGALLSWLSALPLWAGVVIVAVALIVNGVVAEIEDQAPGGFNNSNGKLK